MKAVIVTSGNYFAWRAIAPVVEAAESENWSLLILRTALTRSGGAGRSAILKHVRRWGLRFLCFRLLVNGVPRLLTLLRVPGCRDAPSGAQRRGIECRHIADLNSSHGLELLKEFGPDLLISVSCPYRLSGPVVAAPSVGSFNLHSSALPAYAGVSTYVHALANGDTTVGITVHEMVERFDAGMIVSQDVLPVAPGDTVFATFERQVERGGALLADLLRHVSLTGGWDGRPQVGERTYFSEPTKLDVAAARRHGHRLIRVGDVVRLLRGAC